MLDLLNQLQAIALLPGVVTIIIPGLILGTANSVNPGWSLPAPLHVVPIAAGIGLIALGLLLMVATITLFASVGKGSLAPWSPTRRLVVRGVYRYVRNPMITGVISVLLGEAALTGAPGLLAWCCVAVVLNLVYIPLIEEPGLVERFGEDYLRYRQHVPRWIPRLRPWEVPPNMQSDSV